MCWKVRKNNRHGWRNWQTHYLEVVAPVRVWRFKSSPVHTLTRLPTQCGRIELGGEGIFLISALSSVVERFVYTEDVAGPSPAPSTVQN